jgi:hypothetical protein
MMSNPSKTLLLPHIKKQPHRIKSDAPVFVQPINNWTPAKNNETHPVPLTRISFTKQQKVVNKLVNSNGAPIGLRQLPAITDDQPLDIDDEDMPRASEITGRRLPHLADQGRQSQKEKEKFVRDNLPNNVRIQLDQPFGKDNKKQSFLGTISFRHAFVHLFASGFLAEKDVRVLCSSCSQANQLHNLIKRHEKVDFRPLQGFNQNWESDDSLSKERRTMMTACFLHFKLETPTIIRWLGGPHVAAHRDVDKIIKTLQGSVDQTTLSHLERLFRSGSPEYCEGKSSEKNFNQFLAYGNHKTIEQDWERTEKTVRKDAQRGYNIHMDAELVRFIPNLHLTPQGIANLEDPFKKDRPFFDSTFRPSLDSFAINDWTSKDNEPPISFPTALEVFAEFLWNLRISYPNEEIYLGDDDICGFFRHGKYNPNLVAMHSFILRDSLFMHTSQTFGDCTSVHNSEPMAQARKQRAQFLWHKSNTVQEAKPYLPEITLSPKPTQEESASFAQASKDKKHSGVFDEAGNRIPPPFQHYIDDNPYADVRKYVHQMVSASILALYDVLGYPNPKQGPDAISRDKLFTMYNWTRVFLGFLFNSRKMTIGLTPCRTKILIETLTTWLTKSNFTLLEAAKLLGTLQHATSVNRWVRPYFFALQNAIRHEIRKRYYQTMSIYKRRAMQKDLEKELPPAVHKRIEAIIAVKFARPIWNSKAKLSATNEINWGLRRVLSALTDKSNPWEILIGHFIEREPNFQSYGDACLYAGGAFCADLEFWFDILWSSRIRKAVKLSSKDPGYVHINQLEMVVVILQIAAVIARLDAMPLKLRRKFKNGLPPVPLLQIWTDNSVSKKWAHTVSASSPRGQALVAVLAELLRTRAGTLGTDCDWVAGEQNVLADKISRPDLTTSVFERRRQIFTMDNRLKSWDFFRPSLEFLSLLESTLFCDACQEPPKLPKNLGRFETAGSITFNSSML